MTGGKDEIEFEILADGTLKILTDAISPANHKSADELLRFLERELGGAVSRTRAKNVRVKHREHVHEHAHDGKLPHTH